MGFLSCFWDPCQSPSFSPASVPLSPTATRIFESRRFVMFSSVVTICDISLESTINVSLSYLWLENFMINSSIWIISSVIFLQLPFWNFSSCNNPSVCGWYFFNHWICCYHFLRFFGAWFLFLRYSIIVFIHMSNFFTVVKFWNVLVPSVW